MIKGKFLRLTLAGFCLILALFFAPPAYSISLEGGRASAVSAIGSGGSASPAVAKKGGPVAAPYRAAPVMMPGDYHRVMGMSGRLAVWFTAQMHLWFAAFVLAVPIFVFILEAMGMARREPRYDRVAYEFIRVSITAYSITAITGGLLLFSLIIFYPRVMGYMSGIFGPTMIAYALLFFVESGSLYIYYYGWRPMSSGALKWVHLGVGLLLNITGTALMFIANAWTTFMMSPAGVDRYGALKAGLWPAIHNNLWNPMNLHRFIANIAYGGSIVASYAAYRFLSASEHKERAYYDWMGYTASLIAVAALLPLPFAGYWLTAEIYAYSQQMGITLMGGAFAWLFIIQAVVIGALFLAANYYLWCTMERGEGAGRYRPYVKYIAAVLLLAFLVWFTPHTLVLSAGEAHALGGQYHPLLAPLGLMPAKNTAVNIIVLFTFLSFVLYRRAGRDVTGPRVKTGTAFITALFTAGIINIVYLGVYYGYFTSPAYKVTSSIPQVATTMAVIVLTLITEFIIFRGQKSRAAMRWGHIPARSQYALVLITVSFTWLMGLMGYVRSAIRGRWHVYSIIKDASPDAYTPLIGFAVKVVSVGTIVFLGIIVFIFWLSRLTAGGELEG